MGQCGRVVFYTTHELEAPRAPIAELLAVLGGQVQGVTRTCGPERSWQEALDDSLLEQTEEPFPAMPAAAVPALYIADRLLYAEIRHRALMDRLDNACRDTIPEDVRDNFSPGDLFVCFGPHDLFEYVREPIYIARAFCSVRLFGWGCPKDMARYRELVFQVPEIIEFRQRVEAVLGPLETCATWDV